MYDKNDPPYLVSNIPDKLIPLSTTVFLFNLEDYFIDPEGQEITYTDSGSSNMVITILGTNDVVAYTTSCSGDNLVFTATDPEGLSADSNTINIAIDCGSINSESGVLGVESSSSSGGGGGYSACISNWVCEPWSSCSRNGSRSKTCIDYNACDPNNFVYELEEACDYPLLACDEFWSCTEWSTCSPEEIQTRSCTEENSCGTEEYKPESVQTC